MGYVDRENRDQYAQSARFVKPRLDLTDLLKIAKDQKKNDKTANLLILSGAATVVFVVFLVLTL